MNRKCPNCGNEAAYLCDNCTDPLDVRYYCAKCNTVFSESGNIVAGPTEDVKSDQSAKADAGKPKLTLVPRQIIYDIAEVREYGNNKYPEGGPDNWKKVDKQRYRDALFRHLLLYLDDPQGTDEESGIKHLKHIACNVAFLCELENYWDTIKCPETWEGILTFVGSTEKVEPHCNLKVTGKAEEDE